MAGSYTVQVLLIFSFLVQLQSTAPTTISTECSTSQYNDTLNQDIVKENLIEDTNPHKVKNEVALFFQSIKMYKKLHSSSKTKSLWTSAVRNELQENKLRTGNPLTKLIVAEKGSNDSSVSHASLGAPHNFSESEVHNGTPEASALIGNIRPNKQQGKKNYHAGAVVPAEKCSKFCSAGHHTIGVCITSTECYKRGGSAGNPCCGNFHVCCKFNLQCSETSQEEVVHFQSPGYPVPLRGALACDFELIIRPHVCAVRIDFTDVRLHPKYGGVCDFDQVLILNSVDGPTSAQCGDLTGYTTTVAVQPAQLTPLKIVVIVQNDDTYLWDMRLRQIECGNLRHFRRPPVCGGKMPLDSSVPFYQLLDLWRNAAWHAMGQHSQPIWWRQPAPAFNRFHFASRRKTMDREAVAEDRIIHGLDAELHEFPWQVALVISRVFFCGGVLINDEYVLSAAHCFLTQDTPMGDLVVYLGDHDLTSSNETISEIRGVREVHYHAHFHALLLSNDIAMVRLDRPVTFSLRIRPVCLPSQNSAVLGEAGVVAGWGITSYPDGKPNAILQRLQVQVMSNEFCENALDESLGPGHLCAVPIVHGGTCFGDSGGPLTIMQEGKDTLIGVVSFGITGCAHVPGMPDLYTRVSAYLKWIDVSAIKYFD